MTPIENLLWKAKPFDTISHEEINAARAEYTQLRADLATLKHNSEAILKREASGKDARLQLTRNEANEFSPRSSEPWNE